MKSKLIVVFTFLIIAFTSVNITYNTLSVKDTTDELISQDLIDYNDVKPDVSDGFKEYSTGIECYMAALEINKTIYNRHCLTEGVVTASISGIDVNQKLKSEQTIYADGTILSEDITKSNSKFSKSSAIYTVYNPNNNQIQYKETSSVSDELEATYKKDLTETTTQDYTSKFGYLPNQNTHNISTRTLKEEKDFSFDGEVYSFTLVFNPSAATMLYKRKIKKMSDASDYPTFTMIEYSIKIDKVGHILETKIKENYKIKLSLITVSIKNKMNCSYNYYNEDLIFNMP